PPDDELVLVSGRHPIRAKKARDYQDRRLTERVMAPPKPTTTTTKHVERSDDWSRLPPSVENGERRPSRRPLSRVIRPTQAVARRRDLGDMEIWHHCQNKRCRSSPSGGINPTKKRRVPNS